MITIISPAKTLDFDSRFEDVSSTQPSFVNQSAEIINKLKKLSANKVGKLMNISKDLSELNVQRYQEWTTEFNKENSRPAILTFSGDVYRGMDNKNLTQEDLQFAQDNVRLLSGLHGLLRPLDLIQPYRLEMGTSIGIGRKKNLYQYWGERVTSALNDAMAAAETDTLINLASTEYSKVVQFENISGKVITPVFKDLKNGEYKVVMTWAKLARGMMTGYIIRNRITDVEQLKLFNEYEFSEPMSTEAEWVFVRG